LKVVVGKPPQSYRIRKLIVLRTSGVPAAGTAVTTLVELPEP